MTTTVFSNGTVIQPAWLNDVNTITYGQYVNVKTAGAIGNGIADDTSSFNTAISAANSLGLKYVYIPPGTYLLSSLITITTGISFIGSGRNNTVLTWVSTTSGCLNITTVDPVTISDIYFAAPVNCTAGSTVSLSGFGGTANSFSVIKNCTFSNGFNQFVTVNAYALTCKDNYFSGGVSTAMIIQNVVVPDAGDSIITGNLVSNLGASAIGILQTSSGGLKITNNKILGGTTGIALSLLAAASTSILLISGNSIELSTSAAISIGFGAGSHFSIIDIDANEFSQVPIGISIPGSGSTVALTNLNVNDNIVSLTVAGTSGVIINNVSNFTVTGNTIVGNGGTPTGIVIGGFSTQGRIGTNSIQGCTTKINNGSGTTYLTPDWTQTGAQAVTCSTARGSLFYGTASVTFGVAFDSAPTVQCDPGTISGGVSAWASAVTKTGFTMNAISVTSGGTGNGAYNASGIV